MEEGAFSEGRRLRSSRAPGLRLQILLALAGARTCDLPERSVAFEFLGQTARGLEPGEAKDLVISALQSHPAAQKALVRDVVRMVTARRPQLVPWLLTLKRTGGLKCSAAMSDHVASLAIVEAGRQGWMVFDDEVIDPKGRRHRADDV